MNLQTMSHNDRLILNRIRLWCNGYNLTIRSNGEVLGTDDDSDPDNMIEISFREEDNLIRLLGTNSQLYVCFDDKGQLYGEKDAKNPGTLFMETVNASYSTFQTTLGAKSWFIGIRKNGKPKPGKRTGEAQKDTRFLLRKLMTDHHELRMSHDDRPLANRVRLCCNGYNLAIRSNGEILGSDDVSDPDSIIEITSGGDDNLVRLLGNNSRMYVCFDDSGQLYGEKDPNNPGTIFKEAFIDSYSTFQSTLGSKSWFLGIQRNGKPKPGKKSGKTEKDKRFLLRKVVISHNDPEFSNHVRLWCKGYNLTIRSNGEVLGTDDDSDPDSKIEISYAEEFNRVRLLGTNSQLYVCFDDNGQLYGEKDPQNPGTIFIEAYISSYSTFQSTLGSKSWFIGLRRNGKPKPGKKTFKTQKGTQFLLRNVL
uniref:Uncharacterized protein LOC114329045 n=1 Tax=Diabrotica virgifera virgifera TaxID=50390 RepID=A0A6P7FLJ9_DIAVI